MFKRNKKELTPEEQAIWDEKQREVDAAVYKHRWWFIGFNALIIGGILVTCAYYMVMDAKAAKLAEGQAILNSQIAAQELAQAQAEEAARRQQSFEAYMAAERERAEQERINKGIEAEKEDISDKRPDVDTVVDENGNVEYKPDYTKPEPPPAPEIPDDQKNNPNSKPEYTPEQLEPNKPASNTPSDGDRKVDANGQEWIYVEGFGWHKPTGGRGEVIDVTPNGNKIGY